MFFQYTTALSSPRVWSEYQSVTVVLPVYEVIVVPAVLTTLIVFRNSEVCVVLENVKTAPSPAVLIPVIVLSTVMKSVPIPITVVPAATVEFPPVTVTASPRLTPVVTIPLIETSNAVSIVPAVVATPTVLVTVDVVGASNENTPPC